MEDKIVLKRNKIKSRTQNFWNGAVRLDSLYYFKKNSPTPNSVTHYMYNADGKMIESRIYKKGTLKSIRKFDCQPLGKIEKKVETSSSCENIEMDENGNKIKVSEFTNDKGKKRIFKTTYHGNTNRTWKQEGFDYNNRPTYYNETTDTSKIYKSFNKKGKVTWESNIKLQNGRTITNFNYRKGKLVWQTLFTNNQNGQVSSEKSFINDKEDWTKTYEYNSLGLIKKMTHSKKRKSSTTEREYN